MRMRKYLVPVVVVVLLLAFSVSSFAAKRFVLIDPCHGGRNYGFEMNGKLEKDINLESAFEYAKHLSNYKLYRDSDTDNYDGPDKFEKVSQINPDIILGIHHHGKNAVHIEYNRSGAQVAYQLASYFASEDIPFRLVLYRGPWLFDQPCPSIVLITTVEIDQKIDYAFLAKIIEGLD